MVSWMGASALIAFLIMPSVDLKTNFKLPLCFLGGITLATILHKDEIFE
jgi:hypothetical protein